MFDLEHFNKICIGSCSELRGRKQNSINRFIFAVCFELYYSSLYKIICPTSYRYKDFLFILLPNTASWLKFVYSFSFIIEICINSKNIYVHNIIPISLFNHNLQKSSLLVFDMKTLFTFFFLVLLLDHRIIVLFFYFHKIFLFYFNKIFFFCFHKICIKSCSELSGRKAID